MINLVVFALALTAWGRAVGPDRPETFETPFVSGMRAPAMVANACGFIVSIISNYWLNRLWTFRSSGRVASEMPRFVVVSMLAYALQLFAFWIGLVLLPISHTESQLFAIACVMPFNFVANRQWSFRTRGASEPRPRELRKVA